MVGYYCWWSSRESPASSSCVDVALVTFVKGRQVKVGRNSSASEAATENLDQSKMSVQSDTSFKIQMSHQTLQNTLNFFNCNFTYSYLPSVAIIDSAMANTSHLLFFFLSLAVLLPSVKSFSSAPSSSGANNNNIVLWNSGV